MYIPCVSDNYRLSGMFTCKKRPEVEMRTSEKLDTSILRVKNTHNRVVIRTSDWGKPQQQSWASEWRDPNSGVWFTVAFELEFYPISGALNLVET